MHRNSFLSALRIPQVFRRAVESLLCEYWTGSLIRRAVNLCSVNSGKCDLFRRAVLRIVSSSDFTQNGNISPPFTLIYSNSKIGIGIWYWKCEQCIQCGVLVASWECSSDESALSQWPISCGWGCSDSGVKPSWGYCILCHITLV